MKDFKGHKKLCNGDIANLNDEHLSTLVPYLRRIIWVQDKLPILRGNPVLKDCFRASTGNPRSVLLLATKNLKGETVKDKDGFLKSALMHCLGALRERDIHCMAKGSLKVPVAYQKIDVSKIKEAYGFSTIDRASLDVYVLDTHCGLGKKVFEKSDEVSGDDIRLELMRDFEKPVCDASWTVVKREGKEHLARVEHLIERLKKSPQYKDKIVCESSEFGHSLQSLRDCFKGKFDRWEGLAPKGFFGRELVVHAIQMLERVVYTITQKTIDDETIKQFVLRFPDKQEWAGCSEGLAGKLQQALGYLVNPNDLQGYCMLQKEALLDEFCSIKFQDKDLSHTVPGFKFGLQTCLGLSTKSRPDDLADFNRENIAKEVTSIGHDKPSRPSLLYTKQYEFIRDQLSSALSSGEDVYGILDSLGVEKEVIEGLYDVYTGDVNTISLFQILPGFIIDYLIRNNFKTAIRRRCLFERKFKK